MTSLTRDKPATLNPTDSLLCPSHRLRDPLPPVGEYATSPRHSDPYLMLSQHLPLVRRVCHRFRDCGETVEDLALAGLGGLLEAVAEFEPTSGRGFVPFAMPLIVGAILDHFKDRGWAVRTPGQLATRKAIVDRALEGLDQEFGHLPTLPEIVHATGLSTEMVLETMESRP